MNTRTDDHYKDQLGGTRPPSHLWCALFGKFALNGEAEAFPRLLEAAGVPLEREDLPQERCKDYHFFLRHRQAGERWTKVSIMLMHIIPVPPPLQANNL